MTMDPIASLRRDRFAATVGGPGGAVDLAVASVVSVVSVAAGTRGAIDAVPEARPRFYPALRDFFRSS
jgi:hypothetical protein